MQGLMRIAIIPAYEPHKNMLDLLKGLKKEHFNIILVDDGSGEIYQDIFVESEKYAHVIHSKENYGKGKAIKTALEFIKENVNEKCIIVTIDCDGQHSIMDVKKICNVSEENSTKLIIGKRIRNKDIPLRSKFGNTITRTVYYFLTGIDVYDTQTGLRAFSNELIDFLLSIKGERYEYEMNMLLECSRKGIDIKEVEIETIYIDNNSNSHFNVIKDSIKIYKEIIKFSCSSLVSFVADYTLYVLFNFVFENIILSNIIARCISSTINYTINKNIVFKSDKKIYKSAIQYFMLVIIVLILNTMLLNYLIEDLLLNKFIAKIITEVLLYFFSWFIQKMIIFRKEKI